MLARGDSGDALSGIPGSRIGFLQVADAPLLDMNVLEWSRHFRCFPGEGTLDVTGVVAATLAAGYAGPLSLEVFSDVVREADPAVTAREAMRSLLFLEDQVAGALAGDGHGDGDGDPERAPSGAVRRSRPLPRRRPDRRGVRGDRGLGWSGWLLRRDRDRRRTPTAGGTRLPGGGPAPEQAGHLVGERRRARRRERHAPWGRRRTRPAHALGLTAPPVAAVAARAKALLWPAVDRTRGAGEALLPGLTSPSGLHVFVSAAPGEDDDWKRDFAPVDARPTTGACETPGWVGIDHVGVAVPPEHLNQEMAFFRTLFDLTPGAVEEFIEPHGRLRSRVLRPAAGDLRLVLNVEEVGPGRERRSGINQVAFSCADVAAQVRALRARGVRLMPVPDNYYVDLDARFGLDRALLAELREHQLLYDRVGDGELLHAYTPVLPTGFYVELLERRGGYDGYGSAGTHVRLAAQAVR